MNYSEYLYEIDQAAKAAKASAKFKVGDRVIVNLPWMQGVEGRIVESVINAGASSPCHTVAVNGEAVRSYESHLSPAV